MTAFLSEPIEAIVDRLYAPPQIRRGDQSGLLWWICPFHDDKNPSLCISPGAEHYRCFGCGAHGDAIDFVRRLNPGMSFREALRVIGADQNPSPSRPTRRPQPAAPRPLIERPEGWQDFAREIVAKAEENLWSDQGMEARNYLAQRALREDTIRSARLGYWTGDEWFAGVFPDRRVWVPRGIVIPWLEGPNVALVNVRRLEGDPKYVAILGSRRGGLYPGREGLVAGKPVVIVEGEFDALLLGQELGGSAPVVTLGGAGSKPSPRVKNAMLGASPWIVAGDSDAAGEKSADGWLSQSDRCVRVAPPTGIGKDWTEAHQKGIDLRSWWRPTLDRIIGTPSQSEKSREHPSTPLQATSDDTPEEFNIVDGLLVADLPPRPWRDALRDWPDDWRLRWGGLANAYSHQGMGWREAEIRAVVEVAAERKVAEAGPAPPMDPDPYTALQRDFLDEMIASGEAARFLSPAEFSHARWLLVAEPLDCEAIRSSVHAVMSRERAERNRILGIVETSCDGRWRCHNRYCRNKSRWWMSEHGVVNCRNCRPPSFPEWVIVQGEANDAPFVEPGRSNQARAPFLCRCLLPPIFPDPTLSVAIVAPIPCSSTL